MSPAKHSAICAQIQQLHQASESKLLARIEKLEAQRTWVGLSDEEIKAFDTWHDNREEEVGWCNPSEIVAYIEAKLKQKNGIKE